jgi:hypothetical protein
LCWTATGICRSRPAARGATASIHRLGLDDQVTVVHADGYIGQPFGGPYDRIIVTCGVAGLSPHWLDQLAPSGLILAPVAHGGVHPILAATHYDSVVTATAALWADFMPAVGPLRPAELAGHDPPRCPDARTTRKRSSTLRSPRSSQTPVAQSVTKAIKNAKVLPRHANSTRR